jgi:hypothetical protein
MVIIDILLKFRYYSSTSLEEVEQESRPAKIMAEFSASLTKPKTLALFWFA